jgi:hypothetical protein
VVTRFVNNQCGTVKSTAFKVFMVIDIIEAKEDAEKSSSLDIWRKDAFNKHAS